MDPKRDLTAQSWASPDKVLKVHEEAKASMKKAVLEWVQKLRIYLEDDRAVEVLIPPMQVRLPSPCLALPLLRALLTDRTFPAPPRSVVERHRLVPTLSRARPNRVRLRDLVHGLQPRQDVGLPAIDPRGGRKEGGSLAHLIRSAGLFDSLRSF